MLFRNIKKAIDAGENYPKTFDAAGSINGALELLEKYRLSSCASVQNISDRSQTG